MALYTLQLFALKVQYSGAKLHENGSRNNIFRSHFLCIFRRLKVNPLSFMVVSATLIWGFTLNAPSPQAI